MDGGSEFTLIPRVPEGHHGPLVRLGTYESQVTYGDQAHVCLKQCPWGHVPTPYFFPLPEYMVKRKILNNWQNSYTDSFIHALRAPWQEGQRGSCWSDPLASTPSHYERKLKAIKLQSWEKLQRLVLPSDSWHRQRLWGFPTHPHLTRPLWLVRKTDGAWRKIANLRKLSQAVMPATTQVHNGGNST